MASCEGDACAAKIVLLDLYIGDKINLLLFYISDNMICDNDRRISRKRRTSIEDDLTFSTDRLDFLS